MRLRVLVAAALLSAPTGVLAADCSKTHFSLDPNHPDIQERLDQFTTDGVVDFEGFIASFDGAYNKAIECGFFTTGTSQESFATHIRAFTAGFGGMPNGVPRGQVEARLAGGPIAYANGLSTEGTQVVAAPAPARPAAAAPAAPATPAPARAPASAPSGDFVTAGQLAAQLERLRVTIVNRQLSREVLDRIVAAYADPRLESLQGATVEALRGLARDQDQLAGGLSDLSGELTALRETQSVLQERLTALAERPDGVPEAELDRVINRLSALERAITDQEGVARATLMPEQFAAYQTDVDARFATLTGRVDEISGTADAAFDAATAASTAVAALEQRVNEMADRFVTNGQLDERLAGIVTTEQFEAFEARFTARLGELAADPLTGEALTARITAILAEELATFNLPALQAQVDDNGDAVRAIEARIASISGELGLRLTEQQVKDLIDAAVTDLATTQYVDDATDGLATTDYVDDATSNLATTDYVDRRVMPNPVIYLLGLVVLISLLWLGVSHLRGKRSKSAKPDAAEAAADSGATGPSVRAVDKPKSEFVDTPEPTSEGVTWTLRTEDGVQYEVQLTLLDDGTVQSNVPRNHDPDGKACDPWNKKRIRKNIETAYENGRLARLRVVAEAAAA